MPIVINVEPVFLIRIQINGRTGELLKASSERLLPEERSLAAERSRSITESQYLRDSKSTQNLAST